MNTEIPVPGRNPFRRKKAVKILAICLAAAVLAGGTYAYLRIRANKSTSTISQRTSTVTRGQLTDSIAGSAPIESSSRSELSPKVTATLQKINCKEGDQVKAGDVLFVLDNTDALLNIENTQNNIAQMQLTIDNTVKSVGGLAVKAPYSGQITNISVKEGDTVNKGGAILTITDTSKLDVTLAFSGSEVKNIAIGQTATLYLPDLMLSIDGKVDYISAKPYAAASGGELYNVEISVDNPGSLTQGIKANGEITVGGTILASVDGGSLSYKNSKVIRSDAGGTITKRNVRENEYVNAGDLLLQLENDDLVLTSSTNDIKMENLKSQLSIQQKQLDYYTIKAPFDGTITKMGTALEGDTVKQGEVLAVVSDVNRLQFSVDIDELDISKLSAGQEVRITSDAIPETSTNPLTGKVTKIAMEGNSSNGVTTYPVTVTVDDTSAAKLKTGMNIDAEIIISNKSDVLMVPLEAVTTFGGRSFVYAKGAGNGSTTGNQDGGSLQGERNGQGYGGSGSMGRNTSGAAIGRPADGSFPDGNASGAAVRGNFPQDGSFPGGNASGSAIRGRRWQNGENTSGSAMRGNWPQSGGGQGMTGSTSQGAVQGSFARARRASTDPYYAGATMVPVETGISNGSYIEIISGLTEGETIVLPQTGSSSGNSSNSRRNQNSGNSSRTSGGFIGGAVFGGGGMPPRD